ncbi:DAZ-associated protein 1 [Echinococcus granulosus]|nr:DAZ-associated protein 1 [Echinococcus granulosus]
MESTDADLICGVCKKLMRNPYSLPCGHTFCLQPCLQSCATLMTVSCFHCHSAFDVTSPRPNHTIGAKLSRLAKHRRQNHKEDQKQEGKLERVQKHEEGIILYRLMLRTKMNDLSRHKAMLMSRRTKSSTLQMEKKTKDEIIGALDGAVQQMVVAAGIALDATRARLEKADEDGCRSIDELAQRVTNLFTEVRRSQDAYAWDLQKALAVQKSLERLIREAAMLGKAIKDLRPLRITQMQVSDGFAKTSQHLSDFNLIISDGVVPSPRILSRSECGSKSGSSTATTNINTTVATSPMQLFVGWLHQNHTEDQLRQYFSQYGAITKCCIWRNSRTNKSSCCGFLTYEEEACANRALADCPHFIDGSRVKLEPFNSKKTIKKRGKSVVAPLHKNEEASNEANGKHQLVVDGLPPLPRVNDIRSLFGRFGVVIGVRVDETLHRAFVAFSTAKALQMAVTAAPPRLKGMTLRVLLPKDHKSSDKETSNDAKIEHHLVVDGLLTIPKKNSHRSALSRIGELSKVKEYEKTDAVTEPPSRLADICSHVSLPGDHEYSSNTKFRWNCNSSKGNDFSIRNPCIRYSNLYDYWTDSDAQRKDGNRFKLNDGPPQHDDVFVHKSRVPPSVQSCLEAVPKLKIEKENWGAGGCLLQ